LRELIAQLRFTDESAPRSDGVLLREPLREQLFLIVSEQLGKPHSADHFHAEILCK